MSRRVCARHRGWQVWSRNPAGLLVATKRGRQPIAATSRRTVTALIDAAQGVGAPIS